MKKLLYTLPLLLGLAACSQDDLNVEQPQLPVDNGESYYLTMELSVPTELTASTRTVTTEGGSTATQQEGTINEEYVGNVTLYVLDGDDGTTYDNVLFSLDSETVTATTTADNKDKTYEVRFKIRDAGNDPDVDHIDDLYGLFGKKANLVVVCNPGKITYTLNTTAGSNNPKGVAFTLTNASTAPMGDFLLATADATTSQTAGQILPMASVQRVAFNIFENTTGTTVADKTAKVRQIFTPNSNNELEYKYATSIDVERMVARLDVKDASTTGDWIYPLTSETDPSTLKLKMFAIQPVNVNNKSYVFRHRAGGSTGTSSKAEEAIAIFGNERGTVATAYNWVIEPTWKNFSTSTGYEKDQPALNKLTFGSNFNLQTVYGIDGTVGYTKVSDLASTRLQPATGNNQYYAWWYVLENTIPSTEMMVLTTSTTSSSSGTETTTYSPVLPKYGTGVAFQFEIMNKAGTAVITEDTTDEDLPTECTALSRDSSNKITELLVQMQASGKWMKITPDAEGHLFLTYFGFIKHNDDGTSALAPMKYGVVRNNIYQLSINKIENLPFPDDPMAMFLQLTINVLKWDVRTNAFDF